MYHLGVDWILIHELTGEDVIDAFNRVCNYWGKINRLWYLEAYAASMGLWQKIRALTLESVDDPPPLIYCTSLFPWRISVRHTSWGRGRIIILRIGGNKQLRLRWWKRKVQGEFSIYSRMSIRRGYSSTWKSLYYATFLLLPSDDFCWYIHQTGILGLGITLLVGRRIIVKKFHIQNIIFSLWSVLCTLLAKKFFDPPSTIRPRRTHFLGEIGAE